MINFLRLNLRRAVLNEIAALIGLVGCAGSMAMIGWIPCLLLWLVVRTQTPCSAAWFGGEGADTILLGEVTETSSLSFSEPSCQVAFGYSLLCLYSVGCYYSAGPSEVFLYTANSLIKYT